MLNDSKQAAVQCCKRDLVWAKRELEQRLGITPAAPVTLLLAQALAELEKMERV